MDCGSKQSHGERRFKKIFFQRVNIPFNFIQIAPYKDRSTINSLHFLSFLISNDLADRGFKRLIKIAVFALRLFNINMFQNCWREPSWEKKLIFNESSSWFSINCANYQKEKNLGLKYIRTCLGLFHIIKFSDLYSR